MILIPTFNSQSFIKKTLISALNQTKKVDIVVIDNCSTDNTLEIASQYDVEVIQNPQNIGRIQNWNKCIDIAKEKTPKFFKLLFAGDILKTNAMQEYERIFNFFDVGLITSKYEIIEKDGKKTINQIINKEKIITSSEALEMNFQKGNWYASPSINAYRTKAIGNIRFDNELPWSADWKFCIDLSKEVNVFYCEKSLAEFHKSSRKYFDSQTNKLSSLSQEFFILSHLMEELDLSKKYKEIIKETLFNKVFTKKDIVRLLIKKVTSWCL